MSDIKELVRQRGSIRARLTLFENYLTPLSELKIHKDKLPINELTLRLNKVQDLFYNFDEVQSKIELLDADVIDTQMKEREESESRFYSLIARAQEVLESWKERTESKGATSSQAANIKLPPIKIAPFDGSPSKWLEFRDTYLSLVHDNDQIDNISKYHYLKSYLEGSASAVIKSVSVSASNYHIAWSQLCDRFDNKRLLINHHLKSLFTMESLSRESYKGLQNLLDTITRNLRALKTLGEPTEMWDTLIIYLASTKLDPNTARKWEEHRSKYDSPNLNIFFEFLRHRAEVLETLNSGASDKHDKNDRRLSFNKSKSFITSTSESDFTNNKLCLLANKSTDYMIVSSSNPCQSMNVMPKLFNGNYATTVFGVAINRTNVDWVAVESAKENIIHYYTNNKLNK